MPFCLCKHCGTDFCGEDEDYDVCDDCCMAEIDKCEEETGHKKTEPCAGGGRVCKRCGVLV